MARKSKSSGTAKPLATEAAAFPLSDKERNALRDRFKGRQRAPRIEAQSTPGKPLKIGYPSDADVVRLAAAFGTADAGFANLMLSGLLNAACDGNSSKPPSEQNINEALAAVTGIAARDEVEAMLAVQMVATHFAAITLLRRLKGTETLQQQDSAGNLAVKLLRTYTAQVEALQRYRGKGQQRVTVEHVHVHQGGQAIVGAVHQGGGAPSKSEDQPHAPRSITHEPGQALPGKIKTVREAVPNAGG